MAEDWKVTVTLADESGEKLASLLHEHELEEQARTALAGPVAISSDETHVFLYADTRAAAVEAQGIAASVVEAERKSATFALEHWHPVAEEWQPADVPLPVTEADRQAERERLEAQDTADTQATGYAEWEVRLDLPSHRDAVDLADRLESEGLPTTRRWTFLLVGASNQDEADALAKRLQAEAPAGTRIAVQPGGEMTWEASPRRSLIQFVIPGG